MVQAKSATTSRRMNEIGDESRQRLLDAAEELFFEKGFDATTVVEIGKRAGISHGSIPWHFGNKSGLLYAVAMRMFDRSSSTEPITAGQLGFNRIWREHTYYDNSPQMKLFGAFFLAEVEHSPASHFEVTESHVRRRHLLVDWVVRSAEMDSLKLKVTPEELVDFWIGSSRGLVMQKLTFEDNFDLAAARRALGVAVESLLGSNYFENLDTSL